MAMTALARISVAKARQRLDLSDEGMNLLLNRDVFSIMRDAPNGYRYIPLDELEIYLEESCKGEGRGAAAVRAHRIKMKRVKR